MRNSAFLLFLSVCLLFTACGETLSIPKPRSFPRVIFPERSYTDFDIDYCSFSFQHPDYVEFRQKELFFDETPAHPCWFDLEIPDLNGAIHFTYYPLNSFEEWEERRDEGFSMVGIHNKRASYIDEIRLDRGPEVGGMVFDIAGEAASPFQFFVTDSTSHFVRGALYFNTQARPDSLAPVVEFVKEDIYRMLETFSWTD